MKLKNYHTHTLRCKHAEGSDEEYVKAAIKMGYKVLGFSDHTPWPVEGNWRMSEDEIAGYCKSINKLKEKYKDQIEIKLGLEAEYVPEWMDWLKEMIKKYNIEYLILGNHWFKQGQREIFYTSLRGSVASVELYLKTALEGLETGLYSYFAHPDWFLIDAYWWNDSYDDVSHKICKYCKEHDIPLEYNLGGLRGCYMYPNPRFWKIAKEYGCKAIIGIDAHSPSHVLDEHTLNLAKDNLKEIGIEVIEDIEFKLQEKLK